MTGFRPQGLGLLLLGVGPRLAGVACIVVAIWLGFLWATMPPGAS